MSYIDRRRVQERNDAILFARNVLSNKDKYAILETETTGLKDHDVILWLTIMDLDGKLLLDHLLKLPKGKRINAEAQNMHGVDRSLLKKATDLADIVSEIEDLAEKRRMLVFNENFHMRLFDQTMAAHGFSKSIFFYADCIQQLSNRFYDRNYSSLPGRDHTGEGDCLAVLAQIKKIAEAELTELPELPPEPVYSSPLPKKVKKSRSCLEIGLIILVLLIGIFYVLAEIGGSKM